MNKEIHNRLLEVEDMQHTELDTRIASVTSLFITDEPPTFITDEPLTFITDEAPTFIIDIVYAFIFGVSKKRSRGARLGDRLSKS